MPRTVSYSGQRINGDLGPVIRDLGTRAEAKGRGRPIPSYTINSDVNDGDPIGLGIGYAYTTVSE